MIGVDTNVLVGFLLGDDPKQAAVATEFVRDGTASDPAFVSLVVLVEAIWTLQQVKRLNCDDIHDAIADLLSTDDFVFEDQAFLAGLYRGRSTQRLDVADQVVAHVARRHGCTHTVTFDQRPAKTIPLMTRLA